MDWISVKDRLPEVRESKPPEQGWLILDSVGRQSYTTAHPSWWNKWEGYDDHDVAYWLDGVPAPPKEEEG